MMSDYLKGALLKGADAIDARQTLSAERSDYLNASEALTCIRKQVYSKLDAEQDGPQDWGFARRGKWGEIYMVDRLRAANAPLLFAGDEQVAIADDELRIRCTPDGLVLDVETDDLIWGIEFKTIDPRTNTDRLPRDEHYAQLQIGMAMFDRHRDEFPELEGRKIAGGLLLYMDASNYNLLHTFPVPHAPKILDRLAGRASRVLNTTDPARLPREGKQNGGQECRQRCAFTRICGVDGAGSSTAQGVKAGADPATQVEAYLAGKSMVERYKADQDAAAERLKAILQKNGVSSMVIDGHSVSLTTRAGSVSYAKVVKEHCPDVDLEPYRGNPSEILKVT
jgi:hypothetical protein